MANRTIDLPSVFGVDANNVIPAFPTPGSGYRKEPLLATDIQNGWAYSTLVDSSIHNEVMFIVTSLMQQIAQQGNLSWCSTTAYVRGVKVVGSDGKEYKAVIANANVDPTTAPLSTWKPSTGDMPGKFAEFAMNAPPAGYLVCNGNAVSRTLYPDLFAAIGVTWGIGDGGTTFNVPDLRGKFLRGFTSGSAIDTGRAFATSQQDAIQNIVGTFHGDDISVATPATGVFSSTYAGTGDTNDGSGGSTVTFDASTVVRTSTETRPYNETALICIAI